MSDIEHELVSDLTELRARVQTLTDIARRAVHAAVDAQDRASGRHERWLDEALAEVDSA